MAPPVGAALLVLVAVVLPAVVVAAGGEPQECTRKRDCVKLYGDGFACDQVNGVCYRKQSGNVEPEATTRAAGLTLCDAKKDCKHLGGMYKCKNGVCDKKTGKKDDDAVVTDAPKTTAWAADLTFCKRKKDCKHLGKTYKCKNGVCYKKKKECIAPSKATAISRCKPKKQCKKGAHCKNEVRYDKSYKSSSDDLFCTRKRHCRHLGSQWKCDRSLCTCVRIPTIRTNIDRFDQPDGRLGCNPGFSGPDGCLPDEGEDEDDGRR
eukprot:m.340125 g.340125  ORF g.340125 m.340125 type:complete len:263 (+) comp19824_c1_seq11:210-998(+)